MTDQHEASSDEFWSAGVRAAGLTPLERRPLPDGLVLDRFSVKPHHVDAFLDAWPLACDLKRRHGFALHQAFLETHAEPKLTWLYSHPDPEAGAAAEASDPLSADLAERWRGHIFYNRLVRPVRPEVLAGVTSDDLAGRFVVMRRYSIVNGWLGFYDIWRRIVEVRERYGFRCLFAVADEPRDIFTWAFDCAGSWEDFPAAQRAYYHDPDRVALRGVFDFMADYQITPASLLTLPES